MYKIIVNIDDAIQEFEKRDFKLLSKEIPSITTRVEFICDSGHKSLVRYCHFLKGGGCKECSNVRMREKRSYNFNFVKSQFEKRGCKLLSKSYKNNSSDLEYVCHCGNFNKCSFASFLKHKDCSKCVRVGSKNCKYKSNREKMKKDNQKIYSILHFLQRCKRRKGNTQYKTDIETLGYGHIELYWRLTSHPNWYKAKKAKMTIDHIFPVRAFLDNNIEDLKIIHSLDNLQPLTNKENLLKGEKYNHEEFVKWLTTKGIILKENNNETC